ncbi:ubiquitin interaction motif protein [Venturia nashicola]|uniref:Ubiquitin interaction motif protein n=1 Tax=Venturia nashicola TaxID=86259 RepID=A0A4Z1P517_9PEZI|nr:ubiquitin interaction motif protein [Venturia nashicola]
MAPVVTDELIDSFYGVSGEPFREVIVQYLDHCSGNLEQALGMYLDEPEQSRTFTMKTHDSYLAKKAQREQRDTYSEEAFTADRNNEVQMGMTAFDVQGEDVLSSSTEVEYNSNAPTRPPSPNHTMSGQETGVTGAEGQFIGLLSQNNDHYDPTTWALVPVTSAAEIFLDPTPDERGREDEGEPVVMRPVRDEPLASVITILGHIPLARAILCGDSTTVNYGSSPEWWKGAKIELASISHSEEPHNQSAYDLKEETERLMAFISGSARSYGSIVPLSQLAALRNAKASDGVNIRTNAQRFLTAWTEMAMQLNLSNAVHSADLFQTVALHRREGKEEDERPSFYTIELKLEKNPNSKSRTIYDGVDDTLWGEDVDGTTKDNYCLHKFPHVLFMRVQNLDTSRPGLDMDVPRAWHVDRYLEKNMDAAKTMRRERSGHKETLQLLKERRAKLERFTFSIKEKGRERDNTDEDNRPNDHTFTSSNLLQSTIDYLDPFRASAVKKAKESETSKKNEKFGENAKMEKENEQLIGSGAVAPETKQAAPTEPTHSGLAQNKQLAEQLAKISARVGAKISELEKQREQVQIEMADMSKEFTGVGDPTNRYNLRGVSIGPKHTEQYVLVDPSVASTAQQQEDEAIDVEVLSQWWRIQFNSEKPLKEKTDIESVLKAASETSGDVLLVYATDTACERRELNLSVGLKTFVRMDNEHFGQELTEHWERMDTSEPQFDVPREPPPAYEDFTEHDGRWVHQPPTSGGGFTADPGPSLVSDAEYQMNTDPQFNGYANTYNPYRNDPRDGEDVHMVGTSSERIEDVTEMEKRENRKGG